MLAVVVAEGVAIALLAVLVLGLLRSHALILRALHELGAGLELEEAAAAHTPPGPVPVRLEPGVVPASRAATSRATDIVGTALDGTPARVEVTGEGRRTLLAFLSSGCSVCRTSGRSCPRAGSTYRGRPASPWSPRGRRRRA